MQFTARTSGPRAHTTQNGALGPPAQYQTSQGVVRTNVSDTAVVVTTSSPPSVQYTTHSSAFRAAPMANTSQNQPAGTVHNVNPSVSSPNAIRHIQQNITPISPAPNCPTGQEKFQRLKVEDALSYLDQVKYKFGNQPQVYNDFLDIMKEFKSQSIDTPGVIQRVSNLFKVSIKPKYIDNKLTITHLYTTHTKKKACFFFDKLYEKKRKKNQHSAVNLALTCFFYLRLNV